MIALCPVLQPVKIQVMLNYKMDHLLQILIALVIDILDFQDLKRLNIGLICTLTVIISYLYLFEILKICRAQNRKKCMTDQERCIGMLVIDHIVLHSDRLATINWAIFLKFLPPQTICLTTFEFFSYFLCIDFPIELSVKLINLCRYMEHGCSLLFFF